MLKVIFVSRQIGTIPSVWDVICVNGAQYGLSQYASFPNKGAGGNAD